MSDLSTDAREEAAKATASAAADSTIRLPAAVPTRKLPGGHTIELQPSDWTFRVTGPLYTVPHNFRSYREALADVEAKLELQAAAEVKSFNAIVLSSSGEPITIRGINRRTGDLLGVPEAHRGYLYPNVTWIRKTLLKYADAIRVANRYDTILSKFQLYTSPGHSSMSAETALTCLQRWQSDLQKKFDVAEDEDLLVALEADPETKTETKT